jgi:winged helix-turn-helix protein
VAGARPDTQGLPFTRWSLAKLSAYLREQGICEISPAHLGRVLAEAGLSFQRTRSWKASLDPDYEQKAARVLSLYERPPRGGAVISFDQMGPLSLRPMHGSAGPGAGVPSATGPRLTAARECAMASARSTSTPTASGSG